VNSSIGPLQTPPHVTHSHTGEVAPKPKDETPRQPLEKKKPVLVESEQVNVSSANSTELSYSVDRANHTMSVKIKDQKTGDVVRTLEFKDFKVDAHLQNKLVGHLVDKKI
jgi:uncharacterized FlaG/YvyC family protein